MRFLKVNQANVKASKAMSTAIRLEAISSRLEAIATRVEAMALTVKANKAIVCTTSKVTFCLALPLLVFMRTRHNKGNKRDSRTQTVVKESVLFCSDRYESVLSSKSYIGLQSQRMTHR